jgi:hypothetical protein
MEGPAVRPNPYVQIEPCAELTHAHTQDRVIRSAAERGQLCVERD